MEEAQGGNNIARKKERKKESNKDAKWIHSNAFAFHGEEKNH